MNSHIKFAIGDRVAKKNILSKRGKVISTSLRTYTSNMCEVIWDGQDYVSFLMECELLAESLLDKK